MDERELMSIEYNELIARLEEFQDRLETLCAAVEVEKGLQEITELEEGLEAEAQVRKQEQQQ